jgi:hypothetical protein
MSSKDESPKLQFKLDEKLKYLKDIRHEIKKKRIFFDENKERFGLDEFSQLVKVKNTSEVKGYPFKAFNKSSTKTHGIRYGLKIVPVETKYDKKEHPSNLENVILKELTENIVNKMISPHIAYYLGVQKVSNKSRALKMLNLKRLEVEEKIRTHSNMLISEFVEGNSLDNWVFDIYEKDDEISNKQWKVIVFQMLYTMSVIQHHYRMMHNDFHYGNILIDDTIKPSGYFVYEIKNKKYYIPNLGVICKAWDFEFAMVYSNKIKDSYPNKFITGSFEYNRKEHKTIVKEDDLESKDLEDLNVPFNYNEVYDPHYFLTSLLDLYISQELFDWIISLYPMELIPEEESSSNDSSYSSYSSDSSDSSDSLNYKSKSNSEKSKSKSLKNSNNSDNSDSYSDSDSDSGSENVKSERKYVHDGRLINGAEDEFKLPNPITLINDSFFECFTQKPDDFDEKTALYFNAGF